MRKGGVDREVKRDTRGTLSSCSQDPLLLQLSCGCPPASSKSSRRVATRLPFLLSSLYPSVLVTSSFEVAIDGFRKPVSLPTLHFQGASSWQSLRCCQSKSIIFPEIYTHPSRMFSSRLSGRSAVAGSADEAEQRRQTLSEKYVFLSNILWWKVANYFAWHCRQ